MFKRSSIVNNLNVNAVERSSIIEIGDSEILTTCAIVFALQREFPYFWGDEAKLERYNTYKKKIELPIIQEQMNISFHNQGSIIKVENIDITAMSVAGVVQVGRSRIVDAEARVLNIRHLIGEHYKKNK